MKPARVKVYIAIFAYGGNGGLAMVAPELAVWLAKNYHDMKLDQRIDGVAIKVYSDTPITMTRNRAVRDAKLLGADLVLMLDSDNQPDGYLEVGGDAKPFWKTAFDFSYDRLMKGMPTVIAAPYCGPPPEPVDHNTVITVGDVTYAEISGGEVPYLFQWANKESDCPHAHLKLDLLTRNEAARLSGIYPVAALPTGVCLFTLNAFEGLPQPYFKYEMNADGSEKHSTEDVVATRDISLFWKMTKGWDVLFATCDSWALHHKTKKVGRPQFVPIETVSETFLECIKKNQSAHDALEYVDYETQAQAPVVLKKSEVLGCDVDTVVISAEDMRIAEELAKRDVQELDRGEVISQEDIWEPAPVKSYDGNGHAHQEETKKEEPTVTSKMVAGKKVMVFDGFDVPEPTLEGIEMATGWLVNQRSGPLEVAVLHGGTGQSTAIINDVLPEGSHIYALDCFTPHRFSTVPGESFNLTFQEEISRGRIHADNLARKMPTPPGQQHLDMVFIEQFVTKEKLALWLPHVQPGGLMAGLGYSEDRSRRFVESFAKAHKLEVRSHGDLWVLPIKGTPVSKPVVDEDDERVDLYGDD